VANDFEDVIPNRFPVKRRKPAEAFLPATIFIRRSSLATDNNGSPASFRTLFRKAISSRRLQVAVLKCDQLAKFAASISCGATTAVSLAGSPLIAVAAAAPRRS
jgi:hypothetical protein